MPKTTMLCPGRGLGGVEDDTRAGRHRAAHERRCRIERPSGIGVSRFSLMIGMRAEGGDRPGIHGPAVPAINQPGTSAPLPLIHDRITPSPGLTFVTPAPVSRTMPLPSWPRQWGRKLVLAAVAAGFAGAGCGKRR